MPNNPTQHPHQFPNDQRFQQTYQGEAVSSEYDFDSDDLNDSYMRNVTVLHVKTFSLAIAQVAPLELIIPGRGVTIFDYITTDLSKAPIGTGLVNIAFNDPTADQFPCKYKRGVVGTFSRLYLTWPATALASFDLVIYKSTRAPWVYG